MAALPIEIIEQIIDSIYDKPTLSALRLVCSRSMPGASAKLFRTLSISYETSVEVLRYLSDNYHLIPYIQEVVLGSWDKISHSHLLGDVVLEQRADGIISILGQIPLKALTVYDVVAVKYLEIVAQSIIRPELLTMFRFSTTAASQGPSFTRNITELLKSMPNLEDLELLDWLSYQFYDSLTSLLPERSLSMPRLRSLKCSPRLLCYFRSFPSLLEYQGGVLQHYDSQFAVFSSSKTLKSFSCDMWRISTEDIRATLDHILKVPIRHFGVVPVGFVGSFLS